MKKQKEKNNKEQKITINKLAQITAKGFLEVDKKISDLRTELKGDINGLKGGMNELKEEVNELRAETREGVNKMLAIADGMAKQFSLWKEESAMGAAVDKRHQEQLNDHEKRIVKIEALKTRV